MDTVSGPIRRMTTAQARFANQYASQGCQDPIGAYLVLHPGVKPESARVAAYRMLTKPYIKEYLASLTAPAPEDVGSVKKEISGNLKRLAMKAEEKEFFGTAITGNVERAKLLNCYNNEQNESAQYMQFFDKVSIVVNQNPSQTAQEPQSAMKVIEHE